MSRFLNEDQLMIQKMAREFAQTEVRPQAMEIDKSNRIPRKLYERIGELGFLGVLLPEANVVATTALGTVDPQGREKGLAAGANVLMPNVTPREFRALCGRRAGQLAAHHVREIHAGLLEHPAFA